MNRRMGIASGCFWRYERSRNRDSLIKYVVATGVTGIELTFYGTGSVRRFSLSEHSRESLRSMDFISIHAPDLRKIKNDMREMYDFFSELERLYNAIDADYIVFHVDSIKEFDMFNDFCFKSSVENIDKKEKKYVNRLLGILEENPKLWLCLDVAHAYSCSESLTESIIENLRDRISHIHLSGSDGVRNHIPLGESSQDFIESLRCLKHLETPIILEEDFLLRDTAFIMHELEYAKGFC